MQVTWPTQPKPTSINLPGSKSISNRVLIIRALQGASLSPENISDSSDTQTLRQALSMPDQDHHIEEGGTSFRFLLAFLAGRPDYKGQITTGSRLAQRPHQELVDALHQCGARISVEQNRYMIEGQRLSGGRLTLDGSRSSQFASALLLIAPYMPEGLTLQIIDLVSASYLEMTLRLMQEHGADVAWDDDIITVNTGVYNPVDMAIESDWSSAAVWAGLVIQQPNWKVSLQGLQKRSLQGDSKVLELLEPLGLRWQWEDSKLTLWSEPVECEPLSVDLKGTPDLALPLAAAALGRNVAVVFHSTSHLAHKESNRAEGLKLLVESTGGSFAQEGSIIRLYPGSLTACDAVCPTFKDHRMAFAWSILLPRFTTLEIEKPTVVDKSYPRFWEDLHSIGVGCI